mgnify:CR=1 FL=1
MGAVAIGCDDDASATANGRLLASVTNADYSNDATGRTDPSAGGVTE